MEGKMKNKKIKIRIKKKKPQASIYMDSLITRPIHIHINSIGKNIKQTLEEIIVKDFEGKCVIEGYIKNKSSKIITYSSGEVKEDLVKFEVVFQCLVCNPVEGMNINCIVKNITKAGIRAELNEDPSPVVIFIARDHHYISEYFATINDNDKIKVRIIGTRFELNDKYISIIAELINPREK